MLIKKSVKCRKVGYLLPQMPTEVDYIMLLSAFGIAPM